MAGEFLETFRLRELSYEGIQEGGSRKGGQKGHNIHQSPTHLGETRKKRHRAQRNGEGGVAK